MKHIPFGHAASKLRTQARVRRQSQFAESDFSRHLIAQRTMRISSMAERRGPPIELMGCTQEPSGYKMSGKCQAALVIERARSSNFRR